MIGIILYLAIIVLIFVSLWKAFEKAGRQGWEGIVPFYNIYVMLVLCDKPAWWIVLLFVPIANIVILIILYMEFAKRFGKDAGFGIGLAFLGFIFWPILAFGDATWQGGSQSKSMGDVLDSGDLGSDG
jgi:hypothetical protein